MGIYRWIEIAILRTVCEESHGINKIVANFR